MTTLRTTDFITTSDGVRLAYEQRGPSNGANFLFINGWRQAAAQWRKQVSYFEDAGYRVTTYDHRGHGDSDKPAFGYRVHRLAADLYDLLSGLDLHDLVVVAHSMGVSVVFAFWDLYGPKVAETFIKRLVLVDQSPCLTIDPSWTTEEARALGAVFPPGAVYELARDMRGATAALVKGFFTEGVSAEDLDWTLRQNRRMGDEHAAALLRSHASLDWRDALPRVGVPALVVVPEGGPSTPEAGRWMASQIPGAAVAEFSREEGGSHYVFWENPEKFNRVVEEFAKKS